MGTASVPKKMAKRSPIARLIVSSMAWHSLTLRFRLVLALLAIVGGAMVVQPLFVSAGPITNGPGAAPFTKLGVYQGLLTIAPVRLCVGGANPGTSCPNNNECLGGGVCTASSVMEIGNAGRDIAGSGELYFRPGGLGRSAALRLIRNANTRADLFFSSGSLCIGSVSATTCQSVWPVAGGPGDTNWETFTNGPITSLRATAAALPSSIRIGRPNTPIPSSSGRALEVVGSGTTVVRLLGSLVTGVGIYDDNTFVTSFVGGNVAINGNLHVANVAFHSGAWENGEFDQYPYNSVNKYSGFGPTYEENGREGSIDADTFDSASNLPFASYYCRRGSNPGTSCVNLAGTGPDASKCLGGGVCQRNDLHVVSIPIDNSPQALERLCLRTNNAKLCAGGAAGSNAGTPCVDNSQCTNGATCTSMCRSSLEICGASPQPNAIDPAGGNRCFGGARDGLTCGAEGFNTPECPACGGAGQPACPASARRCSIGGNTCTTNADCFGGGICTTYSLGDCTPYRCAVGLTPGTRPCRYPSDCGSGVCMRGQAESQSGYQNSFCSGLSCQEVCEMRYVSACAGNNNPAAGVCNGYGTNLRFNNGHPLGTTGNSCNSTGICQPGGMVSGVCVAYIYSQVCDCYLDTPKEYYKSQPPGSDGLLCTDYFS